MTDEATEAGGGSSLESILLRRIHWAETEGPALVDRDEFAAHVAVAFDESVPAEAFAARFFAGNPELAAIVPDVAQAFVATVDERLGVYEFELSQLDYVVVENGDKVVVAGEAGQVEARYDESARQAVRAAVIADARVARAAAAPQSRAYLVREDGTVDVLDAGKLAAVLEPLSFRQVAAPVLEQPARRLVRFGPRRRPLSRSAEERVLRENDPRMSLPIGLPEGAAVSERPESAEPAVFLLLPDGSLARPAIGAATRWPQMVSAWTARAALLDVGAPAMRVSGEERFTLTGNRLSALVTRGAGDGPGEVALRSDLRSGALTQVRTDLAPVRILGDDDLAQLVAGGDARLLPGWTAALPVDSYWVQPESWFAPTDQDRALVARLAPASGLDAPAADAMPARTAPASLDVPQAQAPLQAPAADVSVPAATAQPSPALSAPEQVFVQPEPPLVVAPPTAVPALAPATVAPPLAPLAPAPLPIAGPAAAVPIPTRAGAPAP
ncbi:MAG TPA: hypothetical protein VE620_01085, partial [Myxococcales bacterium]|nr:hypothetical protein [Myxococcales bacterium]